MPTMLIFYSSSKRENTDARPQSTSVPRRHGFPFPNLILTQSLQSFSQVSWTVISSRGSCHRRCASAGYSREKSPSILHAQGHKEENQCDRMLFCVLLGAVLIGILLFICPQSPTPWFLCVYVHFVSLKKDVPITSSKFISSSKSWEEKIPASFSSGITS